MIDLSQWEEAEKRSAPVTRPSDRKTVFLQGVRADVAFRCHGQSMRPTFYGGDLVFIHRQKAFSDGQIVAVMIDNGLTLKRLYRLSDGYKLVPDNKDFDPVTICGTDAERVSVYGIAIARA